MYSYSLYMSIEKPSTTEHVSASEIVSLTSAEDLFEVSPPEFVWLPGARRPRMCVNIRASVLGVWASHEKRWVCWCQGRCGFPQSVYLTVVQMPKYAQLPGVRLSLSCEPCCNETYYISHTPDPHPSLSCPIDALCIPMSLRLLC